MSTVVDLTGEEDEKDAVLQLMIENKVLECEKRKAETEVQFWKEKVNQLTAQVKELESKLKLKGTEESSIKIEDEKLHLEKDNVVLTPKCDIEGFNTGAKQEFRSQVRKRLPFEKDKFSNKKFAPSTPNFAPPVSSSVIDISDEDEMDDLKGHSQNFTKGKRCSENSQSYNQIPKVDNLSDPVLKSNIEKTNLEDNFDDGMDGFSSGKRKRRFNIVTSDDEASDEYDDNVPICTLRKKDYKNKGKEDVSRPPLRRLRKLKDKKKNDDTNFAPNIPANSTSDNDEYENDDDDDETLGGFIVGSSESEDESGDESKDVLNEYKDILDKIRRKKVSDIKWELEGDMLANFGKDPEWCMRAVCAIYRQQTEDEKESKVTIHQNARGFSQPDAARGSELAEFLTGGSPDGGELCKTVEELLAYDPNGLKLCMALATKYSKQLFEIYMKKEDPFFKPKTEDD